VRDQYYIKKRLISNKNSILLLALFLTASCFFINAQPDNKFELAHKLISERGEVIIKFALPYEYSPDEFIQQLSPDKIKDDTLYAYANEEQFNWFLLKHIPFTVIPPRKVQKSLADTRKSTYTLLDHYPSYSEYISIMESYAQVYPHLCILQQFGTTVNGHKLLALKISDFPAEDEAEPVFFYSSSLHGDEATGFILLLRLIDSLLTAYSENGQIKQIVDNAEIWINPLSNPDGFYFDSDSLYFNSKRFNANNVDLNRNFPDPVAGDHPDGQAWQPETIALMDFMKQQKITLAANLHDGAELVNYPWDCRYERHPDDKWYWQISRQYADTVHKYSPTDFFTDLNNGITNGSDWYLVYGGKQDYVNYFLHGREVSIELSEVKSPNPSELSGIWDFHKRSLVEYIKNIFAGIHGLVFDATTGEPVRATIEIPGHDHDNSEIISSPETGEFYRLTNLDSCTLKISAMGYITQYLKINLSEKLLTYLLIPMVQHITDLTLFPNPFSDEINIILPDESAEHVTVLFYDISGRKVHSVTIPVTQQLICVDGLNKLGKGIYIIKILYGNQAKETKILKIS
jgi:hypothetical protein